MSGELAWRPGTISTLYLFFGTTTYNCCVLNRILRFGGEVRAEMLKGVNVLADAVAVNIFYYLLPLFS